MKPVDVLQWAFLALIAVGFGLHDLGSGLIVAGLLGIVGSSVQELQKAIKAAREARAERQRRT